MSLGTLEIITNLFLNFFIWINQLKFDEL